VTNVVRDVSNSDVALMTGCNPTDNHPVAATFMKDAAAGGTKLIVINPRRPKLADYAALYLQPRSGTDVALYNAMMNVIIAEDLIDTEFIANRVAGYEELKAVVADYTPERAAAITGVPAALIIEAARMFGSAKAALVFWGMGISQSVNGTNNARCLIALAMITGNVGRPGTGLHPLRGQNNVQGASDAGLIPMVYPDYQAVDDPQIQAKFEALWGVKLSPNKGLTVTEIMHEALAGNIKGMYIMGENPFLSDPNINKVRKALTNLDFLVVQDIFLTETAEFADVILPATSALEKTGSYTNTDRRVQLGKPALTPPGQARPDWQIICEIAKRMGYEMEYESPAAIFDEFAGLTQSYAGLAHHNLGATGKLYPCPDPETSDGTVVMFGEGFPTPDRRARFVAAEHLGADELPDRDYPLILVTGRVLEHWHTGVMTRRSKALNNIAPDAFVSIHPDDATTRSIEPGSWVEVRSRRGQIRLEARLETTTQPGSIFIPFHFREAAANILTTDKVDPDGKIPEFKFCAVEIETASES